MLASECWVENYNSATLPLQDTVCMRACVCMRVCVFVCAVSVAFVCPGQSITQAIAMFTLCQNWAVYTDDGQLCTKVLVTFCNFA